MRQGLIKYSYERQSCIITTTTNNTAEKETLQENTDQSDTSRFRRKGQEAVELQIIKRATPLLFQSSDSSQSDLDLLLRLSSDKSLSSLASTGFRQADSASN
jgi:hypothetical protein